MNRTQDKVTEPGIDIYVGTGDVAIRQRRPAVAASLVGRDVESALQLVPGLLPVCGQAQSVAAGRAVAAARAQPQSAEQRAADERCLRREQALAAAWRCTVDWPDLLGEPRQLDTLKRVRQASADPELASLLQELAPGLDQVTNVQELLAWIDDGGSVPARVAGLALDAPPGAGNSCTGTDASPEALAQAAEQALAQEPFNPLDPAGGPREVGPLAMGRDAMIAQLKESVDNPVLARLLAQVLDLRVIYRALRQPAPAPKEYPGWAGTDGSGLGCAITARGPVFHRVRLDADTVTDWRVLAPTDWHFSPDGPVARELRHLATPAAMRLLIVSFDPCAPWSLHLNGEGA